ncbi:MAG TPA: HTTM domain-containing protein [Gemmataceae bacterium]|nr:HTTM domain-containing protein [Gemmataceae bacterium]
MKSTSAHDAHTDPARRPEGEEHPLIFAVRAVLRFFFHPADPTSLGLMRIATGVLVLYIHLVYCIGLTDYFGRYAWVGNDYTKLLRTEYPLQGPSSNWKEGAMESNGEIYRGQSTWSIFFHVEDPKWLWTIHVAILAIMLLFTLGLWTRVTSVLTWLGSLMYIQRLQNGMLFGMDTMTNLGLLYLMVGSVFGLLLDEGNNLAPCGAALSLDRWLQQRRDRRRLGATFVPQPPLPLVSAQFTTRLIQLNFCFIYFAAGTSKLLGSSWWNATAPNRFLLNYSFAPFDVPAYVEFIKWMVSHRWLWEVNGVLGVVGTLFLELGFPFLVWNRRMRWFMVCGSILFHTLIALLMGLVTFSLMMLALLLAFVPPEAVRQTVESYVEQVRQLFFGRSAVTRHDQRGGLGPVGV